MPVTAKKYTIKINRELCKGCQFCMAFCPENVLAMKKAKAVVINPEKCTGCQLCELYCPDFAIEVEKKNK